MSTVATLKKLVVTTTTTYVFDPDRIAAIHSELQPNPDQYGDDPASAVWAYLHDSLYGADVFEDQGDFDQYAEVTDYDPEA